MPMNHKCSKNQQIYQRGSAATGHIINLKRHRREEPSEYNSIPSFTLLDSPRYKCKELAPAILSVACA
jgi:hypothetical protein